MLVVVDANRIMAALLRDGTTRAVLLDRDCAFVAPDRLLDEVAKHRDLLRRRANADVRAFEQLFALVLSRIRIVSPRSIRRHLPEARAVMDPVDPSDVPYLACALAVDADAVWSHDRHFDEQDLVEVWTNADLLERLE